MSHIRNVDVTHELSDVNVPGILKFVGALVVMTVVVYVLMWLLFGFFNAQEDKKEGEAPPGPMAMTEQESLPPEPRLQAARGFGVKLENGRMGQPGETSTSSRVSRAQGTMGPRAKGRAERPVGKSCRTSHRTGDAESFGRSGLTVTTAAGRSQEMTDYTIGTPTAASSGRVSEKGKQ